MSEEEAKTSTSVRFADQLDNGAAEMDPLLQQKEEPQESMLSPLMPSPKVLDKRIEELRLEVSRKRTGSIGNDGCRKHSSGGRRSRSGSAYSDGSEWSEYSETGTPSIHPVRTRCQKLSTVPLL
jgi:hypothetical protein